MVKQNKPWLVSFVILVVSIGIILFQGDFIKKRWNNYYESQMWLQQIKILKDQKVAKENEYLERSSELVLMQQTVARLTVETKNLSWAIKSISWHIFEIETSLLLLQKAIWLTTD